MKIVAKRKGKVIGYITWRMVGKPKHKLIEMTRIEVDKKYQNQGVATDLFKRMLKRIQFRKLFLTTHASNHKAHKFYEKMGLKYETTLKNHYYDGEDEYVFSIWLDNKLMKNDCR